MINQYPSKPPNCLSKQPTDSRLSETKPVGAYRPPHRTAPHRAAPRRTMYNANCDMGDLALSDSFFPDMLTS